jgi:hypothetical protein
MSKLLKIGAILAVAAIVIAAKQFAAPTTDKAALSLAPASSISPLELMHHSGPLPESKVDSFF